jgi:hypothetical protein
MIVTTMKDIKLKLRILHVSYTLGGAGRKNSTPSIVCHGHAGGTRPDQTRKTPKDLSTHESEESGRGESVGLYTVFMVSEEGGDGEGPDSEVSSLFVYVNEEGSNSEDPSLLSYTAVNVKTCWMSGLSRKDQKDLLTDRSLQRFPSWPTYFRISNH